MFGEFSTELAWEFHVLCHYWQADLKVGLYDRRGLDVENSP
jgi:hypothetical protein